MILVFYVFCVCIPTDFIFEKMLYTNVEKFAMVKDKHLKLN